jgi:hypothetical protein
MLITRIGPGDDRHNVSDQVNETDSTNVLFVELTYPRNFTSGRSHLFLTLKSHEPTSFARLTVLGETRMKRQRIFRVLAALAGLCTVVAIGLTPKVRAQQPRQAQLVAVQVLGTTSKLRDFVPSLHEEPNAPFKIFPLRVPPQASNKPGSGGTRGGGGGGTSWTDPVLQTSTSGIATNYAPAGTSFDGIAENGYVPSDSNLSVGTCAVSDCTGSTVPTEQIVEIANVEYAIYGSSGNVLLPPAPIHTIFNGFTTSMCSTVDGGDPIALFDAIDQRWIISQLAYTNTLNDNHLCIAISTTSDAAGSYNLYDLAFGVDFPDYPKLAVWSDGGSYAGIYLSTNIFYGGSFFVGAAGCAIPLSIVTNPPASGSSIPSPASGPTARLTISFPQASKVPRLHL